jgi:PhnB protein
MRNLACSAPRGDGYDVIEDPFGHKWSMATHLRGIGKEELKAAARRAMGG